MAEEKKEGQSQEEGIVSKDILDAFKTKSGSEIIEQERSDETIKEENGSKQSAEEQNVATDFTPKETWNVLKEKFNVQIPDDLNSDNEFEKLNEVVSKLEFPTQEIHPMAKELNDNLRNPEFKIEEWITKQAENINIMNLKGEDFLKKALPYEYPNASEEEIDEVISELRDSGRMKLQEMELKRNLEARRKQEAESVKQQQEADFQNALRAENERVSKEAEQLFANTKNINEIYGIPISEAERDNYNRAFKELITRDEKGEVPLQKLLQSNEDIWKFAYVVLNGAPKIKEALFNAKEGTKASIFEKLSTTPTPGPGKAKGDSQSSNKPDLDALKRPLGG